MASNIVFVALIACALGASISYDKTPIGRIVGGNTAAPGQFPYMASLRLPGNFHTCGGSIINNYWILTAAHCVVDNTDPITVVVGTNHLQTGGVAYNAAKVIYHSGYDPSKIYNDVALIKVASPIQYNKLVKPISLGTDNIGAGYVATLSGWGKLNTNSGSSESLQYQQFNIVDINQCANVLYPNPIFSSEICAFSRVGQGACQGDSGGPLVVNGVQYGITSWVIPCAVGKPDVYTRVASFMDWIKNTMNTN